MNKLTLTQTKLCNLFDEFIRICDTHNLTWFCDSGTLLGAVRHHGFIPWDNDIDVVMPRDDYNKFIEVAKTETKAPFFFQSPETDEYFDTFVRLKDETSTAVTRREYCGKHHRGLFIDIFCLDNYPTDEKVIQNMCGFLRLIGKNSSAAKAHVGKSNVDIALAFKCMNDILTDIHHQYENSDKVAKMHLFRYRVEQKFVFNKADFASVIKQSFYGLKHKVNIPVGYNNILTAIYGNWTVPVANGDLHGDIFIDAEHNYHMYDGMTEQEFNSLIK